MSRRESAFIGKQFGRYHVARMLGGGGMGRVFLAHDPALNRKVALKVIAVDQHLDNEMREQYLKRFALEAQASARLNHPSLVTVYDTGEENGSPWIAFEYVEGERLADLLKRQRRLPHDRVLPIMLDIAQALRYAHEHGIIHRDVKPANILIDTKTGIAKLSDFGIVKAPWVGLTQEGLIVGTPGYMSPEQINGAALDARSDLFSLGVVFYEAITGRHPFVRDTVQDTLLATLAGSHPALSELRPGIPGRTMRAIEACLMIDRDRRLESANALIERLHGKAIPRQSAQASGKSVLARIALAITADAAAGFRTIVSETIAAIKPLSRKSGKRGGELGARAFSAARRLGARAKKRLVQNGRAKAFRPDMLRINQAVAAVLAIAALAGAIIMLQRSKTPHDGARARMTAGWALDPRIRQCERLMEDNHLDSARQMVEALRDDGAAGEQGELLLARWFMRDVEPESALAVLQSLAENAGGGVLLQRNVETILLDMAPLFENDKLSEATVDFIVHDLDAANHRIIRDRVSDTHYWIRWNAAAIRGRAGLPIDSVQVYILDLKHGGSLRTRLRAANKLGEFGDRRAVPALEEARNKGFRDPILAAAAAGVLEGRFFD